MKLRARERAAGVWRGVTGDDRGGPSGRFGSELSCRRRFTHPLSPMPPMIRNLSCSRRRSRPMRLRRAKRKKKDWREGWAARCLTEWPGGRPCRCRRWAGRRAGGQAGRRSCLAAATVLPPASAACLAASCLGGPAGASSCLSRLRPRARARARPRSRRRSFFPPSASAGLSLLLVPAGQPAAACRRASWAWSCL